MKPPEEEPKGATPQEELAEKRLEAFKEAPRETAEPGAPVDEEIIDTRCYEAGQSEPRELAKSVDRFSHEGLDGALDSYFESKKAEGLFEFAEAQELSSDIILIEQRIIVPIKEKIALEFPDAEPKKIEEAIVGVREGLYSIVLSGHLTAEKLLSKIGAIIIKKTPGAEFQEQSFDKTKAAAYYTLEGGQATIYLYGVFFENEGPDAKAHHVRHEISHILCESGDIWPQEVYYQFLEAAQYPTDENIQVISQTAPALAEILKVLREPQKHSAIWSKYIRGRLQAIESLPPDQQGKEKIQVARELVAEMTSYFLEYGKSEETYLGRRLQFGEPTAVVDYLKTQAGCSTREEFCAKYELSATATPQEILAAISDKEEFAPLLRANKLWFSHLKERFGERGKNIQSGIPQEITQEYADDFFFEDDYEILSPASTGYLGKEDNTAGLTAKKAENPIVAVWDFLTGRKAGQAPPNVIGRIQPQKPEQLPKAA